MTAGGLGCWRDNNTVLRQVTASHAELPDLIHIQEDRNALAEAARIEEIVLVNDPADHPVVADMEADEVSLWGKYIAMPVKIGTVLVGVLMVGRSMVGTRPGRARYPTRGYSDQSGCSRYRKPPLV